MMIVPSETPADSGRFSRERVASWFLSRPAVNWRLLLIGLSLFALFAAFFAYVQYGSPALAGTDGYYHAKLGLLIRQQGFTPEFKWLPLTILNAADFYDHHFLYHVYLAIFTGTDPTSDGGLALTRSAKIASIVLPSLAFLTYWWLLRSQKIRWAGLWALALFAVSEAFLYRMSMPRAQSASLLVLFLGTHWLLTQRYRLLFPLGFLYVWLYNGFPLLIVAGILYVVAVALLERRFIWQAIVYPAAGIVAGLMVNPYFPANIDFIINHLMPKVAESTTRVGNEWYPYQTWTLVGNSGFALLAFIAGTLAWGFNRERINVRSLTLFFMAVLFGAMLFKSRRFVEYFPAFALLFATFSVEPLLKSWLEVRPRLWRWSPLLLALLISVPTLLTLNQARHAISGSKEADRYAEAALWLAENSPPDTMVFQTDWDDFPRLFFYNTSNIYTAGLDPTYLELADKELYDLWVEITRGEVARPGEVIRERFGASYVFSDLDHEAFLEQAASDELLEELYRDNYAVIFAVRS